MGQPGWPALIRACLPVKNNVFEAVMREPSTGHRIPGLLTIILEGKMTPFRNDPANRRARQLFCIISICFLSLLIGGTTNLRAQGFQAGGYFTTVVPRGEFSDNVTNNGYGAGGLFLVRLGNSPILTGGDVGIVVYGSESRREPFSDTIPNVFVNVSTSNNILLAHGVLRLQPQRGWVRPYVDGLIGLKYLFTTTTVSDEGETIASSTDFSDTTFSYGVGGGLQVPIKQNREKAITLDGSVRYLRGTRADYLRKGSIRNVDGQVIFDVFSSRTDAISVQIGVTFRF
jgi:opacity protein-like surface antigen